jgi:hypothetical protein
VKNLKVKKSFSGIALDTVEGVLNATNFILTIDLANTSFSSRSKLIALVSKESGF